MFSAVIPTGNPLVDSRLKRDLRALLAAALLLAPLLIGVMIIAILGAGRI
jgi:hypothetical protein